MQKPTTSLTTTFQTSERQLDLQKQLTKKNQSLFEVITAYEVTLFVQRNFTERGEFCLTPSGHVNVYTPLKLHSSYPFN